MEQLRRLAWWIIALLALNLLSLWVIAERQKIDQELLRINQENQAKLCKQELYRLRAEDLWRIDNRLQRLEDYHATLPKQ